MADDAVERSVKWQGGAASIDANDPVRVASTSLPSQNVITRSITRGVKELLRDDEEFAQTDNAAKAAVTAQSFKGLMRNETRSEADREHAKEAISAQSERYREQIRRQRRCTLEPHSKYVSRWDVVTTSALLFTAMYTPFEVGVLNADLSASSPTFWANRLVDVIFIADISLQCILAYQEPLQQGGAWVYDNWKILRHYATSWMLIDILTATPVDLIVAVIEGSGGAGTAAGDDSTGALQLIRMLRLVKLGRVTRVGRIFRRWQAYLGLSFSSIALIQFLVLTTVSSVRYCSSMRTLTHGRRMPGRSWHTGLRACGC